MHKSQIQNLFAFLFILTLYCIDSTCIRKLGLLITTNILSYGCAIGLLYAWASIYYILQFKKNPCFDCILLAVENACITQESVIFKKLSKILPVCPPSFHSTSVIIFISFGKIFPDVLFYLLHNTSVSMYIFSSLLSHRKGSILTFSIAYNFIHIIVFTSAHGGYHDLFNRYIMLPCLNIPWVNL